MAHASFSGGGPGSVDACSDFLDLPGGRAAAGAGAGRAEILLGGRVYLFLVKVRF